MHLRAPVNDPPMRVRARRRSLDDIACTVLLSWTVACVLIGAVLATT